MEHRKNLRTFFMATITPISEAAEWISTKATFICVLYWLELVLLAIKAEWLHPQLPCGHHRSTWPGVWEKQIEKRWREKGSESECSLLLFLSLSLLLFCPVSALFVSRETLFPSKSSLKITANFLEGKCSLKYIIYHFLPLPNPTFVNAGIALAVNM